MFPAAQYSMIVKEADRSIQGCAIVRTPGRSEAQIWGTNKRKLGDVSNRRRPRYRVGVDELPLVKVDDARRGSSAVGVMGDHDDRLAEIGVELTEQGEDVA